jgi:hypothetical protein
VSDELCEPRLFVPPASVAPIGARARRAAISEDLDEPPTEPQLFDPPLQVVEPPAELPATDARTQARRGWTPRPVAVDDLLQEHFPMTLSTGRQLTLNMAHALYHALAAIGNEKRSDAFRAYRDQIADRARVSVRTLDLYTRQFEAIGLVKVDRIRSGRRHAPNTWRLLYGRRFVRGAASDTSSGLEAQPVTPPSSPRGAASDTPVKKYGGNENVVRLSPRDERQARRARRAAALDSLTGQGSS